MLKVDPVGSRGPLRHALDALSRLRAEDLPIHDIKEGQKCVRPFRSPVEGFRLDDTLKLGQEFGKVLRQKAYDASVFKQRP